MSKKVWDTTYALTEGVVCADVNTKWTGYCDDTDGCYINYPGGLNGVRRVRKAHMHLTEGAALAYAEVLRKKRLAALKRQANALRAKKIVVKMIGSNEEPAQ